MSNEKGGALKRTLGFWDLLALGFGAIIGWGWLAMGGFWITKAGSFGASLAFIIAAIMMCFVGLAYCELTAAMPMAGGVMNFSWRAFGPKVSFFTAWLLCLGYVAMTAWEGVATVAAIDFLVPMKGATLYTIAGNDVNLISLLVALAAALLMFIMTLRGIEAMAKVQNISIIIMVVIVIVFAVIATFKGSTENLQPAFVDGPKGIFSILLMCVLFMGGFDTIPQAAEEMKISKKVLVKVMLSAILLAALWYMITILATSASLTNEEVAANTLAAGAAFNKITGSVWGGNILVISGILGILTSWIALYIGSTRLIYSMARAGMLPEIFAKVHPKHNTPVVAIYFVGATTLIAPFFGKQALTWLSNAGGWGINFGFGMAALSFLVLRFKEPEMERPFKVPMGKLVGIIAVLMTFSLVIATLPGVTMFSLVWPTEALIVIGWLAFGLILMGISVKSGRFKGVNERMKAVLNSANKD